MSQPENSSKKPEYIKDSEISKVCDQPILTEDLNTNIVEDQEERDHFFEVISAYQQYGHCAVQELQQRKKRFEDLTKNKPRQINLLSKNFYSKMREVAKALQANSLFLSKIIEDHDLFETPITIEKEKKESSDLPPREHIEKVSTTLKMFLRDWSDKGAIERLSTYQPLLDELLVQFSHISEVQRPSTKILVPGAGLGRLAFEIAKLGFTCQGKFAKLVFSYNSFQGNEFSYFMLLASSFVLNNFAEKNQYEIFPFANTFSNNMSLSDQLLSVKIPDVVPYNFRPKGDFSMSAGDFLEIYHKNSSHTGQWDAVVSCFFIDTAHNIADYVETIYSILKPGGVWLNLGPLLYHFENTNELSFELTYEELRSFIIDTGFEIKNEKRRQTPYTSNFNSMLVYTYNCVSFVATKPQ